MADEYIDLSSEESSPKTNPITGNHKSLFPSQQTIPGDTHNNLKRLAHFLSDSEGSESGKSNDGSDLYFARPISPSNNGPELDTFEVFSEPTKLMYGESDDDERDIGEKASDSNFHHSSEEEREAINKGEACKQKDATRKRVKKMKPKECIKSVKVVIDTNLTSIPAIFIPIENALHEYGAELSLQPQPVLNAITWLRSESVFLTDEEVDCENDAVIIWHIQEFSNASRNQKITYEIQRIKDKLPDKKITLVLFSGSDWSESSSTSDNGPKRRRGPAFNKKAMEMELMRIQFEHNCSYRMIDTKMEVGMFIAQFTKAISEIPYRREKQRLEEEMCWLASADSRGCVRVDKASNGLSQLWAQQLLQLNNCNLDAVKQIVKRYPTPRALVDAYRGCNSEQEAITLLKDIPVMRECIGDLAAKRKLGREVSRKLYLLFTCKNPDVRLSIE